ncbi:MAG: tRNA (N6-isopentenyl adenosine(37)-C2)-methylthiotransferase MiaB [Bacteroidales bacterium]
MRLFIETFGCQMNFSDSEIVASIMTGEGYSVCKRAEEADLIFINTCSIRDNAEMRVRKRLRELKGLKKKRPELTIGILGCMAERLKEKLLAEELVVDLIAGPDSYRELPQMLAQTATGQKAANVILSEEETYDDLEPVRYNSNGVSAFISIMRGCQNFCSYCVVPYTRGKERSRDPLSILHEARELLAKGYREVTLLGQNVNSYHWDQSGQSTDFPDLLRQVAEVSPAMRIRFATSHPKDLSDKLLQTMAAQPNICRHIHLPVQSGSNSVLARMNRKYTREWYLDRVSTIREYLPDAAISTDIITGFCGETDEEHRSTLSLMRECGYEFAFMFAYSERPDTSAARKYKDDVPEMIKKSRLSEIIALQQELSHTSNKRDLGKTFEVLAEGSSKKSVDHLFGRNSQNKVVVFPGKGQKPGDYVDVKVVRCTSATLLGEIAEVD